MSILKFLEKKGQKDILKFLSEPTKCIGDDKNVYEMHTSRYIFIAFYNVSMN